MKWHKVFTSSDRKDRVTIQEKEKEEIRAREAEIEAKKMAEERRKQTLTVNMILLTIPAEYFFYYFK